MKSLEIYVLPRRNSELDGPEQFAYVIWHNSVKSDVSFWLNGRFFLFCMSHSAFLILLGSLQYLQVWCNLSIVHEHKAFRIQIDSFLVIQVNVIDELHVHVYVSHVLKHVYMYLLILYHERVANGLSTFCCCCCVVVFWGGERGHSIYS